MKELISIKAKDVTKTEETIVPGVLDVRLTGTTLEKLITVRQVVWTRDSKLTTQFTEWRPFGILPK
ncbi:MAG: hypothetical protein Q8J78_06500 [Moraxellaceae bacterium]|nr:hypothetical protein [Moraxellaceae bacterium]